jgi:hypothetical protein
MKSPQKPNVPPVDDRTEDEIDEEVLAYFRSQRPVVIVDASYKTTESNRAEKGNADRGKPKT